MSSWRSQLSHGLTCQGGREREGERGWTGSLEREGAIGSDGTFTFFLLFSSNNETPKRSPKKLVKKNSFPLRAHACISRHFSFATLSKMQVNNLKDADELILTHLEGRGNRGFHSWGIVESVTAPASSVTSPARPVTPPASSVTEPVPRDRG